MSMIETNYVIRGEDVTYRVRPNPDTDAVDGSEGIVIEYRDTDEKDWKGYFFIAPDQAADVARSIMLLIGKTR